MPDAIDEALGFRGPHFLYVYSVDLFFPFSKSGVLYLSCFS